MRLFFDNSRSHFRSHHDSFAGVKTHENSLFLYKSTQANSLIRSRLLDYFMVFSLAGFVSGYSTLMVVPFIAMSFTLPRKLAIVNYFTFHAELLPHTEQVVFHKAGLFGNVRRVYVNIKNLEKIDADIVPSKTIVFLLFFRQAIVGS
jgi:hypothetical protein